MANNYLPGVIQIPSALLIIDITKSYPMVISFTVNNVTASNTYIAGQLVRLNVPYPYKMFQANGLVGQILSVGSTTMLVDIDSRGFDTFVTPASGTEQPASLSPSGSRNLEFSNTTHDLPFQSLNNIGN